MTDVQRDTHEYTVKHAQTSLQLLIRLLHLEVVKQTAKNV